MINEKEYKELINALIEEGFSEEASKKIIEKSEEEGLLDPPDWALN